MGGIDLGDSKEEPRQSETVLDDLWKDSRQGAWSGRGFHFQDVVGAWLAAMVAAAGAQARGVVGVVPEGFEDVSLEGTEPRHVQIKSRAPHLGLFEASDAAGHILDSWAKHVVRDDAAATLLVVFERGISGVQASCNFDTTLAESLPEGSPLARHLREKGSSQGMGASDLDRMLSTTVIVGLPWEEADAQTIELLGAVVELPSMGLENVARQLRVKVADAADHNARARYSDRRVLDRTELIKSVNVFAEQVDADSMQAAVKDGVCEPLDYGRGKYTGSSSGFYEGIATEPFHVEAGLVVRRPDVLAEITSGLQDRSAVVVTGPSGVGKSAVLWTIPQELRGVLWFRVHCLAPANVQDLIRLARAHCVTSQSPVGFLVDSAGTGNFTGWKLLRDQAASVPGLLLVATVRTEDIMALGDLAECATVEVQLDQPTAESIYEGLASQGKTDLVHWLEAYEASEGLTLEYTHILTKGRRLGDVIGDQIARRVREGRTTELEVLALCSAADRWSAEVTTEGVASALGLSEIELREPLDRLREEHLIVERDGRIGGLHQLRSTAICEAIHSQPPPTIEKTLGQVISIVPSSQLHRFIALALIDNPETRGDVVSAASAETMEIGRIAAYLQGLRLADSYELAGRWNEISEQHSAPMGARPVLFLHTVGRLEPADHWPVEFREAFNATAEIAGQDTRQYLMGAIGYDRIAELLANAKDSVEATELLAVLDGIGSDFADAAGDALDGQSPLPAALKEASIEGLAECLAAARQVDACLAQVLVDAIGGESVIIERIRSDNPWITQLDIDNGAGVGTAWLLRIPKSAEPREDPNRLAHDLGRTMLWCFPRIGSVDVKALLPGGHTQGESRLQREYAQPSSAIAWNQSRLNIACAQLGEADTSRLAKALPLLESACALSRKICTEFSLGRLTGKERFKSEVTDLHDQSRYLHPPFGAFKIGAARIMGKAAIEKMELTDSLSELIAALTANVFQRLADRNGYRALAAYISDTVIAEQIANAASEPWRLIGVDGHPQCLDELQTDLQDLHAVIYELAYQNANVANIHRGALTGRRDGALRRAALVCRSAEERRREKRRQSIQRTCDLAELRANVYDTAQVGVLHEYRICIELDWLHEWPQTAVCMGDALQQNQLTGEIFLMVPLRQNKPVPTLGVKLIQTLCHNPEPAGLDKLNEAHPCNLAATYDKALHALLALSAIACLPESQQDHEEVEATADSFVTKAATACEKLAEQPDNEAAVLLLGVLQQLAYRVQAELDGTSSEPNLAVQIATASTQEQLNDDFALVTDARYLALEWEIDHENVSAILAESGDSNP